MYKVNETKRTAMTRRRVISTYPRRVISTDAMMRRNLKMRKEELEFCGSRFTCSLHSQNIQRGRLWGCVKKFTGDLLFLVIVVLRSPIYANEDYDLYSVVEFSVRCAVEHANVFTWLICMSGTSQYHNYPFFSCYNRYANEVLKMCIRWWHTCG